MIQAMGILDRVGHLLLRDVLPPTPALRLVSFGESPGVLPYGVTETTALGLSAVYRSIGILAGAVSGLDWGEWRGNLEIPASRLVRRPAESLTRREWAWRVTATLALYDAAHLWHVGGRDLEGIPWSLVPVPPTAISPATLGSIGDPWGYLAPDEYQIGRSRVPASEVTVIRRALWPTVPDHLAGILRLARVSLATSLSAEGYASRYWQTGGSPITQISTEAELTTDQADEIAARWRDRRAQGPDYPAVMGKGAKAEEWGADPTEASAVEARRELVADVGRYFGIPSHLLNAPTGDSLTYATTESEGLALVRYTVAEYLNAIQDGISDLLPGSRVMRINPSPLTRGEQEARYRAWASAIQAGWLTTEEVRAAEGYPPQEAPVAPQIPVGVASDE